MTGAAVAVAVLALARLAVALVALGRIRPPSSRASRDGAEP